MHRCELSCARELKILEDDFTAVGLRRCWREASRGSVRRDSNSEMRKLRRCVGLRCDVALWAAPRPISKSGARRSWRRRRARLVSSVRRGSLPRSSAAARARHGDACCKSAGAAVVSGRIDSREAAVSYCESRCRCKFLLDASTAGARADVGLCQRRAVSLDDGLPIVDDVDGDDDEDDEDPSAPPVVAGQAN